jgi:hypothetical protein
MSEKLKPCPFCGKEADEDYYGEGEDQYIVIGCEDHDCIAYGIISRETPEINQAISDWNTRVHEPTSPFTSDNE